MCRSTTSVGRVKREFLACERLAVLCLFMVVVSVRVSSSTLVVYRMNCVLLSYSIVRALRGCGGELSINLVYLVNYD